MKGSYTNFKQRIEKVQLDKLRLSILDDQYIIKHRQHGETGKPINRKTALGPYFRKKEERQGEILNDLKKMKKRLQEGISQCYSTDEEINFIKAQLSYFASISNEWEKNEKYWLEQESQFLEDKEVKFFNKLKEKGFIEENFMKSLIDDYRHEVDRCLVQPDYGKYFIKKMGEFLGKQLQYRLMRRPDYESQYDIKSIDFADIFRLHHKKDKLAWNNISEEPNSEGLVELIYLLKRLREIGLLGVPESKINEIAFNFFRLGYSDISPDINRNSFKSTKQSVATLPENCDGKVKFSEILISKIDKKHHKSLIDYCTDKSITIEQALASAIETLT
jgi:hypothetical protein